MASLQMRIRLLQDLRSYLEAADGEELSSFGEDLRSVETSRGASVGELLASLLDKRESRISAPVASAAPAPLAVSAPAAAPAVSAPASAAAALDDAKALIEPSMKEIPAGKFVMGSDEDDAEKPSHQVALGMYRICDHLITCTEYALFLSAHPEWAKDRADPELRDERYLEDWGPEGYPEGKGDHPVAFVSFFAAEAFASWLGMRLPTEAEWERAARGGLVGKKFPGGDQMNDKLANFAKQRRGTTSARSYEPNGFGLYDMAGNLFEWTADWYGPYAAGEAADPRGPRDGDYKVVRGGSWMSGAGTLKVSARFDMDPRTCGQVGLRVAR